MPKAAQDSLSSRIRRLDRWGAGHPFLHYTLPLTAWVVFITVASLAPSSYLPQFKFDLADKVEHISCYALFGLLFLRGWAREESPTLAACLLVGAICTAWGLYLEFMQRLTGYRRFDWWDEFCSALGVAAGVGAWVLAQRWLAARKLPGPLNHTVESLTQESEESPP